MPTYPVRAVSAADLPALRHVLDTSGLFPAELIDAMIAPYLAGGSADVWLAVDDNVSLTGFAYAVPERMTAGTWNLLAIAVDRDRQGQGAGTALVRHLLAMLAEAGERLLIVETSGLPDYLATRRFYAQLGFTETACIPDFYDRGEDKIILTRPLG